MIKMPVPVVVNLMGPNTQAPGMFGLGGGRIRCCDHFVPSSRQVSANTKTYNHYSLLRSLETLFGLSHLGYADKPDPGEFGTDVYSR